MKKSLCLLLSLSMALAGFSGCSAPQNEATPTPEGSAVPSHSPAEQPSSIPAASALSADIVVVGSGLSGMAAATYAAQNGASVILVEKQGYFGGGIVASPGNMAVAEIAENEAYHLSETTDTLAAALERWNSFIADTRESDSFDPDRVATLMVESMKTLSWLGEMGATFTPSFQMETNGLSGYRPDVPAIESGLGGAKVVAMMQSAAENAGAQFLSGTTATGLTLEDGKVKGVTVQTAEGERIISAKAVILAAGGFGANDEMVLQAVPELAQTGYYYQGIAANTGDGITMAAEAGAATYDDGWVVATTLAPHGDLIAANKQFGKLVEGMIYTVAVEGDAIEGASIADQIIVNKNAERVINEAANKSRQLAALIDSGTAPYYALYSGVSGELSDILESGLSTGFIFKADTLEDLAAAAGMDGAVLQSTVTAYNGYAASGNDEQFGKPAERLYAVANKGPYYLVRVVPSFVATMGGVVTNKNYQALAADGSVINGLYAVGEMAHRFLYTRHFISGASNGFSVSMGKLAAEHALTTIG